MNAPTWVAVSVVAVALVGAIVIGLTCITFMVKLMFGDVDPAANGLEIIYDQLDDADNVSVD